MRSTQELLKRWQSLVEPSPGSPWKDEAYLYGYFQGFRPDGEGLDQVFEGLVLGAEVLERVRDVFDCTATSYQPGDAYFVHRNCRPCRRDMLIDLGREYVSKLREIAEQYILDDLRQVVDHILAYSVTEPNSMELPTDDSPSAVIHESLADWVVSMGAIESEVHLLDEAFYSIACDYLLQFYLKWPLYQSFTPVKDPFRPYFRLWQLGANIEFPFEGECRIYYPSLEVGG